jgi:hypothetical protein
LKEKSCKMGRSSISLPKLHAGYGTKGVLSMRQRRPENQAGHVSARSGRGVKWLAGRLCVRLKWGERGVDAYWRGSWTLMIIRTDEDLRVSEDNSFGKSESGVCSLILPSWASTKQVVHIQPSWRPSFYLMARCRTAEAEYGSVKSTAVQRTLQNMLGDHEV